MSKFFRSFVISSFLSISIFAQSVSPNKPASPLLLNQDKPQQSKPLKGQLA